MRFFSRFGAVVRLRFPMFFCISHMHGGHLAWCSATWRKEMMMTTAGNRGNAKAEIEVGFDSI